MMVVERRLWVFGHTGKIGLQGVALHVLHLFQLSLDSISCGSRGTHALLG